MDFDKPRTLSPMVVHDDDEPRSEIRPDAEDDHVDIDDGLAPPGDRRERRGDSLW